MGIVEKVGTGVTLLNKGDRVVMPFNVADGRCRNCEEGKTAFCTGVNPGFAGGAYGYVGQYFDTLGQNSTFVYTFFSPLIQQLYSYGPLSRWPGPVHKGSLRRLQRP